MEILKKLGVGLLIISTYLSAVVYEDAENMDTVGWSVYADPSFGATISNVFDSDRNSHVLEFNGAGLDNGYMLGGLRSERWNNTTEKTIEWSMNYAEDFIIYIAVETTKGTRYLNYTNLDYNQGIIRSGSIHHGLGVSSADGTWQTFTRDLEADLQEFDSDNSIIAVNAFMIRGSGKVDDVSLSGDTTTTVYEDAEDMDTVGWSVYAGENSDAIISNVFDSDKNSYVIKFDGSGLDNGYMLGALRAGRWNNTTDTTIEWSMNYAEDFIIYIAVQTTKGTRYLNYSNLDYDQGLIRSGSTHHGLGADSADGTWRTFTRDLEADLQEFDSDNSIIAVNAFMIRGSGKVDDIHTIEATKIVYEDAEDMDTVGWSIYAGGSSEGIISNVFDSDKNSYVIEFDGAGLESGYMLGALRAGKWNNTTNKTIEWSMNYAENFIVYIAVQTTKGTRYLNYSNLDYDQGYIRSGSTHHGLGADSADGTWQTFTRDLEADLQEFDSDNSIIAVNAFMIRGSGKVDDISLSGN